MLVALKGSVSYAGFLFISEAAPTVTDIIIGTVAIPVCLSYRSFRGDVLAILFAAFPLIHWLYWSGAEVGLWFASEYWTSMALAFSAMVAMIFPWERLHVVLGRLARLRMALRGPSRVFGKAAGHRCRASARSAATDRG